MLLFTPWFYVCKGLVISAAALEKPVVDSVPDNGRRFILNEYIVILFLIRTIWNVLMKCICSILTVRLILKSEKGGHHQIFSHTCVIISEGTRRNARWGKWDIVAYMKTKKKVRMMGVCLHLLSSLYCPSFLKENSFHMWYQD